MGKGKDRDGGPSANQLRGLSYNQQKPKFLQNIGTALAGPSASSSSDRPPIPTRPDDDPNEDAPSDEDAYDLGEEAPQVVVLKEGRHLTKAEADEEAKKGAPTAAPTNAGQAARKDATLRFSSNSGKSGSKGKRKIQTMDDAEAEDDEGTGSFNDLVKRTKTETAAIPSKTQEKDVVPAEESEEKEEFKKKTPLTKEEKAAMKAKRKAAKKMLSFED